MSFQKLNPEDIQISSDSIVTTLWSNNQTVLNVVYKETTNSKPYIPVFSTNPTTDSLAETQFSINYGNINGSGSAPINSLVPENSPTRINYGQIRTLINGDENTSINFGNGNTSSPDVYIININRARYKEKLFLNTFNIHLGCASGSLKLTNDSKDTTTLSFCDAGRVFNIVSGSNGSSINNNPTVSGSYGKFLPDVGLILLNPRALTLPFISGGIEISIDSNNNTPALQNTNTALFNSINLGGYFSLNSEETITSDYIFVRVKTVNLIIPQILLL